MGGDGGNEFPIPSPITETPPPPPRPAAPPQKFPAHQTPTHPPSFISRTLRTNLPSSSASVVANRAVWVELQSLQRSLESNTSPGAGVLEGARDGFLNPLLRNSGGGGEGGLGRCC